MTSRSWHDLQRLISSIRGKRAMSQSLGHLIQELTGGKPFVFVIMGYNEKASFWTGTLKPAVQQRTNLSCIRADEVPGSGHDLLDKIHRLIDSAELVIAEISTTSQNVFYEIGYAIGRNRPLLLLADRKLAQVPTDMLGREVIWYEESIPALTQFVDQLQTTLDRRVSSRLALLRDMLLAEDPTPAYIAASPRSISPQEHQSQQLRSQHHHRTFGDNLGIRGLLEAFGSLIGEGSGVELISAQFAPPRLREEPRSLYLIGSKKVNPLAGLFVESMQRPGRPHWYLGKLAESDVPGLYLFDDRRHDLERDNNFHCQLYQCTPEGYRVEQNLMGRLPDRTPYHQVDRGILIRAPHPLHPKRLVVIMAGPHGLGSGAACVAATNSRKIREIQTRLINEHGISLADKSRPFWVLVEGRASDRDGSLDESDVRIVDVGPLSL